MRGWLRAVLARRTPNATDARAARWRQARLAALAVAAARLSHDVRGQMTSALLAAERLQAHDDPALQRLGEAIDRIVVRTTELMRSGLADAREGPSLMTNENFALRPAVAAACGQIPGLMVVNQVAPEMEIEADRAHLMAVLADLARNAAEAGAKRLVIEAETALGFTTILVGDDGPGLPESVRSAPFRPFGASARHAEGGLGLATARDVLRAHRGDMIVVSTGPEGTQFALTLPAGFSGQIP